MRHVATLAELIEANALALRDNPALIEVDGSCWTYAQMQRGVDALARALQRQGIGPQDRVVTVLSPGIQAAIGFLGAASCAVVAPLNPTLSTDDFSFLVRDLEPALVLMDEGVNPELARVAEGLSIPVLTHHASAHSPADTLSERDVIDVPNPDDIALLLYTSGTTSRPKRVPLRHAQLAASAHTIASTLALSQHDRCLNVMPLFHIHGLMAGLLASLVAGGTVICAPGFKSERVLSWLEQLRPTWLTAVPTIHQAILSQLDEHGLDKLDRHTLRLMRSSSAAMPPRTLSELEARLGVPVIETYGMTEATHQIASNPLPPSTRKPGSVGRPTGVDVAILDVDGRQLPGDAVGEIALRGDTITRGYESNPGANAEAFVNGWLRTGDEGRMDEDGYLYLTGRIKEMINRGGEKIAPRDIDEALLTHPDVAQALAFSVDHASMGEDVAAAVILKPGAQATEGTLRAHLLERISEYKVPSRIVFVDEIPAGPTGKLQRIGLAKRLEAKLRVAYVAPTTAIEKTLADIWAEVLRTDRVGREDNFFALGGDSLSASRVLIRVTAQTNARLTLRQMFDAPTLKEQATSVQRLMYREDAQDGGL